MTTTLTSASGTRQALTPDEAAALLTSGREHAVLDVRESADAQRDGVLLTAVSLPWSVLEDRVLDLIPRLSTPVLIVDGDGTKGGVGERAQRRLVELGYDQVSRLAGGTQAWVASGRLVHTSTQVIGQAFGEFIEHADGTPAITAEELHQRIADGEDVLVVDSRPAPEFAAHSLPGAVNAPGAEGVRRVAAAVASEHTLVVVNCAGRTRSILGAQALRNAGLANPVVSLAGGTMAWRMAGYELDHGRTTPLPEPDPDALSRVAAAAARHAERLGVRRVDQAELATLQADADRTTFVLDVRAPIDFEGGHLPGARNAPHWEAHAWIQRHVGVRHARVVIAVGSDPVLGLVTAAWLQQHGWAEIFLYNYDDSGLVLELETGPAVRRRAPLDADRLVNGVSGAELLADANGRWAILDLQPSRRHRITSPRHGYVDGHIPGAVSISRLDVLEYLAERGDDPPVLLTSPDGVVAAFVAEDAADAGFVVHYLRGGTDGWIAEGGHVETGPGQRTGPTSDVVTGAWELPAEEQFTAFRAYLAWELSLPDALARDELTPFRSLAEVVGPA